MLRKRVIWGTLCLAATLLASQAAEGAPAVFVDPPSSEVLEQEYLWVEVALNEEVLGLTGYDVIVSFDDSVLELMAVEAGELPDGYAGETFFYWTDEGLSPGSFVVNGAVLGGHVDGPGALVRMQFRALAPGTSEVVLSDIDFRNIDNQPIVVASQNGVIEVLPVGRLYFEPSHSEVLEFATFWVDVMVDAQMTGVTGYDLVIDFDEELLDVLNVVEGGLPVGYPGETFLYWTDDGTPSDALVVNGALLGGSVDGPGSLVRIEFIALVPGLSPLAFSDVELRDITNASIPTIDENGDVLIVSSGRVYIDPPYASAWENGDVCVDVAIDGLVLGLTGFHILIDFDENLLDPTSVSAAGLMTSYPGYPGTTVLYWSDTGQPSNSLLIDGAFLGGSVNGAGALVTICFHALSTGTTPLDFVVVEFRDLDNNEILVGSVPGVIEIESEPNNVEVMTWGAIKSRYR
jgi:hypothetical protein